MQIKNNQSNSFKKIIFPIIIILAVGGIFGSVYYYRQYQALRANPNLEAQKEIESLISAIGKLMELPDDETPVLATVLEKEKLADQPFFTKAENGDKLLAYTKAKQAILYRPSAKKIINVIPISISQEAAAQDGLSGESAADASVGFRVAYYNGGETIGLAKQAEEAIKASYPDYQTGVLTNAASRDYKKTLVVDISGTNEAEVAAIAALLNGEISSLPEGEVKPDADILVIVGE